MSGIRRDGTDRMGGGMMPSTGTAIVIVDIFVDDGGGGMGADDQHPMPHATEGRPADAVATVIVRFPPLSTPPWDPFTSSASLY